MLYVALQARQRPAEHAAARARVARAASANAPRHAALRDAHAEYLAARFNRASKSARQALELQQDVDVLRSDNEFAGLRT